MHHIQTGPYYQAVIQIDLVQGKLFLSCLSLSKAAREPVLGPLLFYLSAISLDELIKTCGFQYCSYADESQLCLSASELSPANPSSLVSYLMFPPGCLIAISSSVCLSLTFSYFLPPATLQNRHRASALVFSLPWRQKLRAQGVNAFHKEMCNPPLNHAASLPTQLKIWPSLPLSLVACSCLLSP